MFQLTLTAEQSREIPQLGHVESLEDLALVAGTITIQDDTGVLSALVLVGKSQTGTDGNLSADDTVTAVEVLGEHVHGAALSVGNTLAATKQLTNDGSDRTATHEGETVASVRSDDVVLLGNSVLNTDSNSLLTSRQVAETANLLLLVQTIGSHLHLSERLLVFSVTKQLLRLSLLHT